MLRHWSLAGRGVPVIAHARWLVSLVSRCPILMNARRLARCWRSASKRIWRGLWETLRASQSVTRNAGRERGARQHLEPEQPVKHAEIQTPDRFIAAQS